MPDQEQATRRERYRLLEEQESRRERFRLLEAATPLPDPPEVKDQEDLIRQARAKAVHMGIRPPNPLPPLQEASPTLTSTRDDPVVTDTRSAFVLPTKIIENLPDEDEDARNKLWLAHGLELPSGRISQLEKNKWGREYEQKLHRADPVTWGLLVGSAGDPDRKAAVLKPYTAAMGLLYQVEKAPPAAGEQSEAFRDAFRDWTTGRLVKPTFEAPNTVQDVQLPEAARRLDPQAVEDLHTRYITDPRNLSTEDKQVMEAIRGKDFFAFWDAHKGFYVPRLRMEKLTGQKVMRDKPPQIYADQAGIERGGNFLTRLLGVEREPGQGAGMTSVPETADFRVEDLRGLSPVIANLAAAAEGIRQQQTPPEAPQNFTGPLPTPGLVARGVAAASPYVGSAMNMLTLGVFEAVHDALEGTGRVAGLAFQGDPKSYDAYAASIPSAMWKGLVNRFDPKGSDALAQYDRFWRDTYPLDSHTADLLDSQARLSSFEATRNAMVRLSNSKELPATAAVMRQLGLSDPQSQEAVSGLASGFVDDGTGLIMMALGSSTLWRAARGFPKLGELQTPVSKAATQMVGKELYGRMTEVEKTLTAEGIFSPIPAAQRVPLLEAIQSEIGKVKDPKVARDILGRLHDEVAARGPLDPQLTAGVLEAVKDVQAKLELHGPKPLSPEFKRAFATMADPIADLGITESGFVLKGGVVTVGPRESLKVAKTYQTFLEHLDEFADKPTPAIVRVGLPRWKEAVESAAEITRVRTEFARRREAIGQVAEAIAAPLPDEIALHQLQITHAEIGKEASISNFNDMVREGYRRWQRLEFEGGERPSANPDLNKARYRQVLDLKKTDPNPGRTLLQDPKLLHEIAGADAQGIRGELRVMKAGDPLPEALPRHIDRWLEEHARPDIEIVQPAEKPRTALRDSFEKTITDSGKKAITLTKAQLDALNEVREVPLNPSGLRKVTDAFDRDLKVGKQKLKDRQAFQQGLQALKTHLEGLDPLKPDRGIKIPKATQEAIEAELGSPGWTVRKKNFVSLSPGLADRYVTGRRLWEEATKEAATDVDLLQRGMHRFSALDFAIAAVQGPTQAIWMQRYHQKFSADLENLYRVQAKALNDFLGEELSAPERVRLNEQVRRGDTTDSRAARVIQKLQSQWLDESYKSGRITKEQYEQYAANTGYYHGVFERKDQSAFPAPVYPVSSKLVPLKINPLEFKAKIPEQSYYAAWKEGDHVRMFPPSSSELVDGKPVFPTAAEAEAWLTAQNLPEGTEAAIHAPWTVDQKRAAGLIDDAGHSTMTLAKIVGQNNAKAVVSRALRYSDYAKDEAGAAAIADPLTGFRPGEGFKDRTGTRWFHMDEPKNPWLNGRYVSEDYLVYLRFMGQDFKWRSLVNETLGEVVRGNELIPAIDRTAEWLIGRNKYAGAVGKAVGTALHVFGISKVPLSVTMLPKQWISNFMWNLRLGGFETFSPTGFARYLETGAKGASTWKNVLDDPIWKGLASRRMIEVTREAFDGEIMGSLQKNWKEVEPLKARLDHVKGRIAEIAMDPESPHILADLQSERMKLESLLDEKTQTAGRSFLGGLISKGIRGLESLGPKGATSQKLYNFVGIFDDLSKHQLVQHLMEDRGMSMESALDRAEMAMQNLNRVPDAVKGLSSRLGGSKFVTYPYNKLQTLVHAAIHRPLWLLANLGGLAASNAAMIYAQGKSWDEEMEGHALSAGWGKRSLMSNASYLLGRIKTPMGDLDSSPIFDVFMTQSPPVKRFEDQLTGSEANPYRQAATEVGLNVLSKFIGGNPIPDAIRQISNGVDSQGRSVKGLEGIARVIYQTLMPEATPGTGGWSGRDWNEFWSMTTTPYMRPFTGEVKSGREFLMRRIIGLIPPGKENSTARFQGAMEAVLSERPNRLRDIAGNAYMEHLDNYLYSRGAIREDGTTDMPKAIALTREWQAQEERQGWLLTPEGKLPDHLPDHVILEKATRGAQPGLYRHFAALTLNEMVASYANWRLHDRQIDPLLDQRLKSMIGGRVGRGHPDYSSFVKDTTPLFDAWRKDPRMPVDAKMQIAAWLDATGEKAAAQNPPR